MAATPVKPTAGNAPPQTIPGRPIKVVYGPGDLADFDTDIELGEPGEFPFTRGPHREMYRKQFWTMRQFAGFGTAADSNARTAVVPTAITRRPSSLARLICSATGAVSSYHSVWIWWSSTRSSFTGRKVSRPM